MPARPREAFEIHGHRVIVTNPLRTAGRLASDGAHELAHLLLEHDLSEVREVGGVMIRTCKPDEKEQTTAFGDTLLLPRPLLTQAALSGDTPTEIAATCGVTVQDGALPL